ncbi:MAG: aspartate aminotransferase family protein [Dehalococcoidia bacterium]
MLDKDPRSTEELLAVAQRHLFRTTKDYAAPIIAEGKGATMIDRDGKEYLDFGSGQMAASLGHNHPRIAEALKRSCERILHLNSRLVSEEVIQLAERLAGLLPEPLRKSLFLSTGGESTEVALKVAKMFTGKFEMVGIIQGYHGHTGGAMSVTFMPRRAGFGPWAPGGFAIPTPHCYRCPLKLTFPSCDYACARLGFEMVDSQTTGSLAGFIAEPILSAAGIIEPPPGYFQVVKELCQERGMLFILDEAQTGLGRVGAMFAFQQDGVVPDILALSKTLGAGMPLAATITTAEIEEDVHQKGMAYMSSHQNDPFAAAVGLAVLDVIIEEGLVEEAQKKGQYLRDAFNNLKEEHPIIGDVRGRGLLLGIELVKDPVSKEPAGEEADLLTRRCLENGLVLQQASYANIGNVWRIAPPLTITYEELDRGVSILEETMVEAGL